MKILVGLSLLVLGSSTAGPAGDLPDIPAVVGFWAKPGARGDPRVLEVETGCCGRELATARVVAMPDLVKDAALQPEVVLEFGPEGQIIQRWPKPAYLRVTAVAGARIVIVLSPVPEPGVVALFIASDGSFESPYIAYPVGPRPIPCPPLAELASCASWRCFEYSDLESKQKRFLAYEEACP